MIHIDYAIEIGDIGLHELSLDQKKGLMEDHNHELEKTMNAKIFKMSFIEKTISFSRSELRVTLIKKS